MKDFKELTDGIKTFEDVCAKNGQNPADILPFANPINKRQLAANDREKLDYIAEYLQDGFVADYTDWNQRKWYPWFDFDSESGFGFSLSYCALAFTNAGVGSRLSFPTEEISDFFGKQFIDLHNSWLINKY